MAFDPLYCDLLICRFEAFSSKCARLAGAGEYFEVVAVERERKSECISFRFLHSLHAKSIGNVRSDASKASVAKKIAEAVLTSLNTSAFFVRHTFSMKPHFA